MFSLAPTGEGGDFVLCQRLKGGFEQSRFFFLSLLASPVGFFDGRPGRLTTS